MLHAKRFSAASRRRHLRTLVRVLTRGNTNAVLYFRSLLRALAAKRMDDELGGAATQAPRAVMGRGHGCTLGVTGDE